MSEYRTVISSDGPLNEAEHWLRSNMVFGYAQLLGDETSFVGKSLREYHLETVQSGGRVELLIDDSSDNAHMALKHNVPCLLFGTPKFVNVRRESRTSWSDIEDEVRRQKEIRADALLKTLGSRWE